MSRKRITGIILVCALLLCVPKTADAGSVWKLSPATKSLQAGQICKVSVKHLPRKAKVRWKSSKKSVVKIVKAGKKSVKIKAVKPGKAYLIAKYKGKTKKCRITVKSKPRKSSIPSNTESPVMNARSVALYYIEDKYKSYVPCDATHQYEFQFKVNGTKREVDRWRLTGENAGYFSISDDGVIKGVFEPVENGSGVAATVEATLEDGQKVTAEVKLYGEVDGYIDRLLSEFEAKYITGAMTEWEKMEKVAWYIGDTTSYEYNQADWRLLLFAGGGDCYASRVLLARMCKHMGIKAEECRNYDYHGRTLVKADGTYYLIITGFDEPKPRSYMISTITDESQLKKILDENGLTPKLFE